jgi:parallel beta-helix repeat protein
MKKWVGIIIFSALMIGSASGATLTVNASGGAMYTRIQDAVNAASNGDTIVVAAGIYNENVVVNKPVSLIGAGAMVTIVNASNPNDHVFNITVNNVNISGFTVRGATGSNKAGINLVGANYANISNNIANSNYYGIYLYHSSGNNLTSNTVNSNNGRGIFLYENSDSNILTNNTANSNYAGITLSYSFFNILTNNTANSNVYDGISIGFYSSRNILTNNTANSNNYGIALESSYDNILTNNTAKENNYLDVRIYADSNFQCNNAVENTIGSGDKPIKYFNNSVNLQNEILSELILCNADNSNVRNVIIEGSATKKNNMLLATRTDYSNLVNINSSNNYAGIYLSYYSNNNTLINNTANSNNYGIDLNYYSNNNILINNTANSKDYGIYLFLSDNNAISNNIVNLNSNGIYLQNSNNNILTSNTANSNNYGIFSYDSSNNTIYNNIFNNTINNAAFLGTNVNNTWNTTKQLGTNIIGGPYKGGNFWISFSQTCADADSDGICDSAYTLASGNIDYLPLSLNFTSTTQPVSTIGYSATVATGQNTFVQSSNGSFGLLLKGQTKTINNSVILNNTGDISARVEARFNDSIAGVFGLVSGANVFNATNFALGLPSVLVPLNNSGADVQVAVAPPGVTALDARLGVPNEQAAGDYSGTVVLTFSNEV